MSIIFSIHPFFMKFYNFVEYSITRWYLNIKLYKKKIRILLKSWLIHDHLTIKKRYSLNILFLFISIKYTSNINQNSILKNRFLFNIHLIFLSFWSEAADVFSYISIIELLVDSISLGMSSLDSPVVDTGGRQVTVMCPVEKSVNTWN